jgi:tetratricopeptide (TPR) repeat protein
MRGIFLTAALLCIGIVSYQQGPAKVTEYKKVFKTYPFSDPDPIPEVGRVYPYYRYDGYTNKGVNKEWKVVELENDYIKVMILPEIGGKIWAAFEKTTGKSFVYYNQVVKFRDVAMRGPWTSGGIEANYGIVGHTPNCATPVDYVTMTKKDGSVSCVIGVLDLLTRTSWRIDINLEKDKAFFTTSSSWFNSSPFEQPYYTWMNTGIKAKGNLEFVYPGTKYIGHAGEYSNWPIDDKGRNISFYEQNNFGEYKSYHVFGKYTDFFGGYYHDEDFGMGRYSTHDAKPGKKVWIWGLSEQGMIWDKLLTDNDGQYVEVQSGRLYNQPASESSFTPFKNRSFTPHATDKWTEYWFPVLKTKGFVAANSYGALNAKNENGTLTIRFMPLQQLNDEIKILDGDKVIYSKKVELKTMQLFADSIKSDVKNFVVRIGNDKLIYDASPEAGNISRPVKTPEDFNWKSVQGLHLQGKELIRQRMYPAAEEKLREALKADANYLPALTDLAMVLYRGMKYEQALENAKKALSVDTYDPAANYYYGLINTKLGKITDAKDGFDIASQAVEYRSASYTQLAQLYLKEHNNARTEYYAKQAIDFNKYAVDAYELLAILYRIQNNKDDATKIIDTILKIDPLNHFAGAEKYLWDASAKNQEDFTSAIRNEMPGQTFLELASFYYNAGRNEDALKVLEKATPDAEILYWKAVLSNKPLNEQELKPGLVFPFRPESAEILQQIVPKSDHWLPKYHLALIQWSSNNLPAAKKLFDQCGDTPAYAPFYAARAKLYHDRDKVLADLQKARELDKKEWRYGRALINYYIEHQQYDKALATADAEYKTFPDNYILGMLYARTLIMNKDYATADKLLSKIEVLPNEGATIGRQLYRETKLMMAVDNMKSGNCKKALQYLEDSRQWPTRLGSGKPYDEDIDSRVEDWMTYQCLVKTNQTAAAKKLLDKIIAYKPGRHEGRPSVNNLVTAWALKKVGKGEEGEKLLKDVADKYPDNKIAKWTLDAYNGNAGKLDGEGNESYEILRELMAMKS